jgi:hypothetical protein
MDTSIVASFVALTAALTGCGSSNGGGTSGEPPSASPTDSAGGSTSTPAAGGSPATVSTTMPSEAGGSPSTVPSTTPSGSPSTTPSGSPSTTPPALPDDVEYIDLDEGTFQVGPGQEAVWCVRIPIPQQFVGRTLAVIGQSSDLPAPTHHFFMAYSANPVNGTSPVPCSGSNGLLAGDNLAGEFDPSVGVSKMVFGAGVGKNSAMGNPDYGKVIDTTGSFVTNHHVLNTGTETVNMYGHFRLAVRDATKVKHPVNQITCADSSISIAPGQQLQVDGTCTMPFDMDVVLLSSHAHARLQKFEIRLFDGTTTQPDPVYTSDQWDSPKIELHDDAPFHMKKGQGLSFRCYYENDTTHTINWGNSASDEMCVSFDGYTYPGDDRDYQVPPMLSSNSTTASQLATLSDSTQSGTFF